MVKAILGKKIGMTQIFDQNGNVVPVTVLNVGPCVVSQVKSKEKDGYEAVQIGFGDIKLKYSKTERSAKFNTKPINITMPMQGHFLKNNVAPKKVLKEFRPSDISGFKVGDVIKADIFSLDDKVDVVGQSWTPEQYRAMYNKGFFGGNTGALGYEYKIGQTWVTTPEMYEKLYKERGGKMMGGNNHYDLTNKADLINVSSDDKFYDEYTRIQKAVKAEQKAQSDAKKKAVEKFKIDFDDLIKEEHVDLTDTD